MTGVLLKREDLDTDKSTEGMPREEEGRDQGDASTSHGMPEIASKRPETSGEAWNRVSLTANRGNHPCQYLDFGCLASTTTRQLISDV